MKMNLMMINRKSATLFLYISASFFVPLLIMTGCNDKKQVNKQTKPTVEVKKYKSTFNGDSAYLFVKQQVDFGPRVPGTIAHEQCADYLFSKLNSYCDTTILQQFKARVYNGKIFDSKNIIGVFNPNAKKRVLLCAHWDSRPYADHDPNPDNYNTPIDGANDGASGVGVLLEIARQLFLNKPEIGVDILLFDIEDYGPPENWGSNAPTDDLWALGAQYWSNNPHVFGYNAAYGILLDMVGNTNPRFLEEQYSKYFAPRIIEKIWNIAANIGYGDNFIKEEGGVVNDDHVPINVHTNIPTVNIIHQNFSSANGLFYDFWHTINDNMDSIDRNSLQLVGDVVLTTIMYE